MISTRGIEIFFSWRINFKLPIKYEEINVRIELIWITVVHFASGTMDCGGPFGKYSIRRRDNPRQGQSEELNVTTFHRFPFRLNFLKNSVFRIFRPLLLFLTLGFFTVKSRSIWWFFKSNKKTVYMFFSIYADKNLTRLREPPPLIFGKKGGNGAKNSYFFFHTVFALWLIKRFWREIHL